VLGHVDDADVKVILEGNLKGLGVHRAAAATR